MADLIDFRPSLNGVQSYELPSVAGRTPFQEYLLLQLTNRLSLKRESESSGEIDPATQNLIRFAVYSAFRDCLENDLCAEARDIVNSHT